MVKSMKDTHSISVAMATYNGEEYIKEQLDSILVQLNNNDEIVISDDGSSDNTINIINSYKDKRIKLINGPKLGVKKNFENAIKNCQNEYIFLADQDDIWVGNKVEIVLNYFIRKKADLIIHDCDVVNNKLEVINESFYDLRKSKKGKIKNIFKNSYIGCCMAFKSSFKDKILPIPNNIEMHDQWIGLKIERYGKVKFINEKLIHYRRHDNNVSLMKHYPLFKMLKNRIIFIKEFMK